ncbi:hypothetical protein BKA67DRAFT_534765 [Truncatella angustata]|uniref:F-box domain-containing protein n=1 Tax=Truncatella angustata TaxID=152316 RepID=A0A9P8UPC7_9PEZI|nr:uncharacterized protein BKA67DRAFT_534765 [Truncatella angustata]KAH6655860.1 hypothetical protein BKA67DRAFT_534765 [Truncatella angustata]
MALITMFPNEILCSIQEKLSTPLDLINFASLCKGFRRKFYGVQLFKGDIVIYKRHIEGQGEEATIITLLLRVAIYCEDLDLVNTGINVYASNFPEAFWGKFGPKMIGPIDCAAIDGRLSVVQQFAELPALRPRDLYFDSFLAKLQLWNYPMLTDEDGWKSHPLQDALFNAIRFGKKEEVALYLAQIDGGFWLHPYFLREAAKNGMPRLLSLLLSNDKIDQTGKAQRLLDALPGCERLDRRGTAYQVIEVLVAAGARFDGMRPLVTVVFGPIAEAFTSIRTSCPSNAIAIARYQLDHGGLDVGDLQVALKRAAASDWCLEFTKALYPEALPRVANPEVLKSSLLDSAIEGSLGGHTCSYLLMNGCTPTFAQWKLALRVSNLIIIDFWMEHTPEAHQDLNKRDIRYNGLNGITALDWALMSLEWLPGRVGNVRQFCAVLRLVYHGADVSKVPGIACRNFFRCLDGHMELNLELRKAVEVMNGSTALVIDSAPELCTGRGTNEGLLKQIAILCKLLSNSAFNPPSSTFINCDYRNYWRYSAY